jgi:hypothetical protein
MGSIDYVRLFAAPGEWSQAARTIRVFILHATWVEKWRRRNNCTAVDTLKRLGLAIGLTSILCAGRQSAAPPTGSQPETLAPARSIAAGGTIDYIRLNEPWAWAHAYEGPQACHWPNAKIAAQIAEFSATRRKSFRNVDR